MEWNLRLTMTTLPTARRISSILLIVAYIEVMVWDVVKTAGDAAALYDSGGHLVQPCASWFRV